jgi:HEAT repeat protein
MLGDPAAFEVYYAVLAGEKKSGDTLLESQSKMIHDPKALAKIGFEQGIGFVPFGGASYAAFKMMTKDDVSPVRSAAASKLSKDPDPKSQRLLESAVSDKKWLVRAAAIDALAKRGNPASIGAVVPALDDGNDVVKFTACAAVIRLVAAGSK